MILTDQKKKKNYFAIQIFDLFDKLRCALRLKFCDYICNCPWIFSIYEELLK